MLFREVVFLFISFWLGIIPSAKKNAVKIIQGLLKNNSASLRGLSKRCIDKRVPSTIARFLSSSPWNPHVVNMARVSYFQSLKQVKARPTGIISLDDTISKKHGQELESAGYHYSHTENQVVLGQDIVGLHYKDEKKEYCLNYKTYLNKDLVEELNGGGGGEGVEFQTRMELACSMVRKVYESGVRGQTIAMDAWFPSKALIEEVTELGYHWVGRIKSNRICYDKDGKRLNIKELGASIPDKYWQKTAPVYESAVEGKESQEQYVASKLVDLKTVGKVKMVFVRPSLEEDIVLFAGTDRFDLYAREILDIYTDRWSIETFFRDCKQNLALSDYMGRSFIGFERFVCLVFTAYSFIKYLSLTGFWGRNNLPRGTTFGADLANYHQLCFEYFISAIYDVSRRIAEKEELLVYFRDHFFHGQCPDFHLPDEHVFYDVRASILAAVG